MIFLPIVERELRVAARRRSTYWIRCLAPLIMFLVCAWMIGLSAGAAFGSQSDGRALFSILSGVALCFALFAGVRFTADCISEEKREGTLGLLFLTDLNGYDVVIGKLVSNSTMAFYGLLAVMPVLGLSFILGGVTRGEVARMVLVLMNTVFFSLTTGILVSAISRHELKALSATCLTLGTLAILPFLFMHPWFASATFLKVFLYISPTSNFWLVFSKNNLSGTNEFWTTLGCIHLLSWLFLTIASATTLRVFHEKASDYDGQSRLTQRSFIRSSPRLATLRARMLDKNPIAWLVGRERMQRRWLWIILASIGLTGFAFHSVTNTLMGRLLVTLLTLGVVNTVLKFWIAAQAAKHLPAAGRNGALDLILGTSLTREEILQGQTMGLHKQFAAPVLLIFVLHGVFAVLELDSIPGHQAQFVWLFGVLMMGCLLIADSLALPWVALSLGMFGKKTGPATIGAILRVMLVPWIISIGALLIGGMPSLGAFQDMMMIWAFIGIVTDLVAGANAFARLCRHFQIALPDEIMSPAVGLETNAPPEIISGSA